MTQTEVRIGDNPDFCEFCGCEIFTKLWFYYSLDKHKVMRKVTCDGCGVEGREVYRLVFEELHQEKDIFYEKKGEKDG